MSLSDKITQFETDVGLAHQVVHGGPAIVVQTEGGPIRSLSKIINDADAAIRAQAPSLSQLAADDGGKNVNVIAEGIGAIVRSVLLKSRDVVSVLDYADSVLTAHGNGIVDDYGMFARAIAANPGKSIFVPDPKVRYRNGTGQWVLPDYTTLDGASRKATAIQKDFDGYLFKLGHGANVFNFNLQGNGAARTGGCFQYVGTNGNQGVRGVRAQDWEGPVSSFEQMAGSQSVTSDCTFARRNAGTGTDRYAVVIAPDAAATAVPRIFTEFFTDGACSFDFGGSNNTFVSGGGYIGDLKYSDESRCCIVTGMRLGNQVSLTMRGHNNVLNGDLSPEITLAAGTDNCHIENTSLNKPKIIDNSGNNRNTFTTWVISYDPVITSGGTPFQLGNGTLTGNWSRVGGLIYWDWQLTIGSTTVLGTGGYSITLPQKRHSANAVPAGQITMSAPGFFAGVMQIAGAVTTAQMLRDSSGSITYNSPATLAAGHVIRGQGVYSI